MNKHHIVTSLIIVLAAIFILPRMMTGAPVRVGFILPLSGPVAHDAEATKAGALLAAQDVRGVDVIVYDSEFNQSVGLDVATKATSDDLDAVFSSYTYITSAVSPIFNDAGIPLFYDSCNCGFAEENPLAFQNYFNPRQECRQLAERARDTGVGKVAQLSVDTDYARFCTEAMVAVLGANNVWAETVENNDNINYSELLQEINDFGAETVALIPSLPSYHQLFAANQGRGFDTELFCYEGTCMTDAVQKTVSPFTITNVYTFGIPVDAEFAERFEDDDFTTEQIFQAALAYDTVNYAKDAVEVCGEDQTPECFVEAVKNNATYESQLDSTGFDADGFLEYTTQYTRYTEGVGEVVEL